MIKCQNCGNLNGAESHFCRFCGTKFNPVQPTPRPVPAQPPPTYDYAPPRPYAWKTDEFTTQNEARKTVGGTAPIESLGSTSQFGNNQPRPLVYAGQQDLNQPYQCPHCGSRYLPRIERRISTGGWVTFAILLVAFFPLFWIGLLIKEDYKICPACQYQVG